MGAATFWPVPGMVVSDGRDIWRDDVRDRLVQVERIVPVQDSMAQFSLPVGIAPFGQNFGSLRTLLERKGCYGPPILRGSAIIAGRETYVVDLGPGLCVRGSGSDPESAGRAVIWVDKQTAFVMQYRLFDPDDPSKLLAQVRVTRVRYHVPIDARLLRFSPPPRFIVADTRPRAASATQRYDQAVGHLAARLPFPLFASEGTPAGLTPIAPRLVARGSVLLAFIQAGARAAHPTVGAARTDVAVVERRATAADLERHAPGAVRMPVEGAAGWYSAIPGRHRLRLVRAGTVLTLSSSRLGRDTLIAFAATFWPDPNGHPPVRVPGIPVLRALRLELSFPVFVPTKLPAGFRLRSITAGNGRTSPSNTVILDYSGPATLSVFEGWDGCCLDQDLRTYVAPVRLRNGVVAYRLMVRADFGGTILWWHQAGAVIVLSGPNLSETELLRIARSMSSPETPR